MGQVLEVEDPLMLGTGANHYLRARVMINVMQPLGQVAGCNVKLIRFGSNLNMRDYRGCALNVVIFAMK